MKKRVFLSLFFFIAIHANAQNFWKKSSITLSGGPSFAIGAFADKNVFNRESGLAAVGGFIDLSYTYKFSQVIGAVVSFSVRAHELDKEALEEYAMPRVIGSSVNLKASSWRFNRLMGGLSQTIPISKDQKFSLEIKELIGIQFSRTPEIITSGFIPGIGLIHVVGNSQSDKSFAYGLNLGLHYKVAKNLKFDFYGAYQGSSPSFTYTDIELMMPNVQYARQSTSAINVGLGLTVGF